MSGHYLCFHYMMNDMVGDIRSIRSYGLSLPLTNRCRGTEFRWQTSPGRMRSLSEMHWAWIVLYYLAGQNILGHISNIQSRWSCIHGFRRHVDIHQFQVVCIHLPQVLSILCSSFSLWLSVPSRFLWLVQFLAFYRIDVLLLVICNSLKQLIKCIFDDCSEQSEAF